MAFRFVPCNQDFNRANVELHNSGALGLVRVEMCQAFQTLHCNDAGQHVL